MPATGAGLLRFFEEESKGIKVSPQVVVVAVATLLLLVLIAQRLWPI